MGRQPQLPAERLVMPYKLAPHVPLVVAKGRDGKLHHHYQHASRGANGGPLIPWLNDEQREHFLSKGLVVEVSEHEAEQAAERAAAAERRRADSARLPENGAVPELVEDCIKKLDEAEVPSDAGAPTCRTALRDRRISFSNETIAAAVKQRKLRSS